MSKSRKASPLRNVSVSFSYRRADTSQSGRRIQFSTFWKHREPCVLDIWFHGKISPTKCSHSLMRTVTGWVLMNLCICQNWFVTSKSILPMLFFFLKSSLHTQNGAQLHTRAHNREIKTEPPRGPSFSNLFECFLFIRQLLRTGDIQPCLNKSSSVPHIKTESYANRSMMTGTGDKFKDAAGWQRREL